MAWEYVVSMSDTRVIPLCDATLDANEFAFNWILMRAAELVSNGNPDRWTVSDAMRMAKFEYQTFVVRRADCL